MLRHPEFVEWTGLDVSLRERFWDFLLLYLMWLVPRIDSEEWAGSAFEQLARVIELSLKMELVDPTWVVRSEAWEVINGGLSVSDEEMATLCMRMCAGMITPSSQLPELIPFFEVAVNASSLDWGDERWAAALDFLGRVARFCEVTDDQALVILQAGIDGLEKGHEFAGAISSIEIMSGLFTRGGLAAFEAMINPKVSRIPVLWMIRVIAERKLSAREAAYEFCAKLFGIRELRIQLGFPLRMIPWEMMVEDLSEESCERRRGALAAVDAACQMAPELVVSLLDAGLLAKLSDAKRVDWFDFNETTTVLHAVKGALELCPRERVAELLENDFVQTIVCEAMDSGDDVCIGLLQVLDAIFEAVPFDSRFCDRINAAFQEASRSDVGWRDFVARLREE
jgi:hypothetical protein